MPRGPGEASTPELGGPGDAERSLQSDRADQVALCSEAARRGRRRVAICGASSSGLIAAKEILEAGSFDVVLFERKADVGGVYSSDASYEGARLTASNTLMCFGCLPSGEESRPVTWPIPKYVEYLEGFSRHFGLRQLIRFETSVRRAAPMDARDSSGNPLVEVVSGPATDDGAQGRLEAFHHFVCCTGNTGGGCHPAPPPEWPGSGAFRGRVLHANGFKSAKDFAGRRVLIVGLGESGSDISWLLCRAGAASVCVQTRAGPGYVVPREVLGRAADLDTTRAYHAIPWWLWPRFGWRSLKLRLEDLFLSEGDSPAVLSFMGRVNSGSNPIRRFGTKTELFCLAVVEHGAVYKHCDISHFAEDRAVFADGSEFECDTVIFCGGYCVRFPIFDRSGPGSEDGGARPTSLARVKPRQLYKRIVSPELGLLFSWVGFLRPGFGAIPPVAEMQARLLARWLAGAAELPPRGEMELAIKQDEELDLEQFPHDAKRIGVLGDFSRWMNGYADLIGCQPRLTWLLLTDFRLWWRVLVGQMNGMQFRLHGPGATRDVRLAILSMPLMPLPVLLVELGVAAACKVLSLAGLCAFELRGM